MNPERLHSLDFFRFLAATAVVVFHYFHMGPLFGLYPLPSKAVEAYAKYGLLGVHLFFAISGFVIMMSAERRTASTFLYNRAARLLPLFWASCVFTFTVVAFVGPAPLRVSPGSLLASFAMLPAVLHQFQYVDGVYWTLGYEWLFYFVVAFALASGLYRRHFSKLLFAGLVVSLIVMNTSHNWFVKFITMAEYLPYFVAGASFNRIHAKRAEFIDVFNLAFSFLLALKWSEMYVESSQSVHNLNPAVVKALICIGFAAFLLMSTGKLKKLNSPFWAPLGGLTYALYLTHQNVGYSLIGRVTRDAGGSVHIVIEAIAGAMFFAYLVWRFFEKPLSALLQRKVCTCVTPVPKWKQPPTLDEMSFEN